ncbi:IS3 family transposase, partial [Marinimicrobium alkaliphilum]|uniref:IS3 family transposase n=1 Tax=Marinimicrobium alkaliphilum TaxID=2202654 RepID=UPI0038CBFD06
MEENRASHKVVTMCEYLDVSTSGYYDWRDRPASNRAQYDALLVDQIVEMHRGHEANYGAVRVHPYLRGLSYSCSRRRINRLMKAHGIRSRYHAHRVRRSNGSNAPIADNLLAGQPPANQSGQHWAGDMTYLKTREGDFYLAAVLDLWSRKLIGWAFSRNHDTDLVKGALDMSLALETRQPGCLFHSDQGSEYRSDSYRARLAEAGIVSSMSRAGTPTDNAYVESFFKTLRNELLHHRKFNTLIECVARILEYIEFYNERRIHS